VRADAERWFRERTSRAGDWPVDLLRDRKSGTVVSIVLPALDEEPTVGRIVAGIVELAERTGLVDEIVVMALAQTSGARIIRES